MIGNGEIRRQVAEKIKPNRLKIFGYSLVYGLIISMIASAVGSIFSLVTNIIGFMVSIPIGMALKLAEDDVSAIANLIGSPFAFVFSIIVGVLVAVFGIGYLREMLLCTDSSQNISPIDFFKLGLKDYKRTAKVYLRLWLKFIPPAVVCFVGEGIMAIGLIAIGNEIVQILLTLTGLLLILIGGVWSFIILLLYQTIEYEIIHDDTSDAKQLLAKSRETIRGHLWQWTKMNYFYSVIFGLIAFAVAMIFTIGLIIGTYMISNAGNGASAIGVLLMIFDVIIFIPSCIAISLFLQYFSAKNIFNKEELYKAITSESIN